MRSLAPRTMTASKRRQEIMTPELIFRGAAEFSRYGLCLLRSSGGTTSLRALAEDRSTTERVATLLRAAADAGSTLDPNWALQLTAHTDLAAAFLETLRSINVFDRLLPDMVAIPARTNAAVIVASGAASEVEEGRAIPVREFSLSGAKLIEHRAAAILIITDELVRTASPLGLRLLQTELRGAIAQSTDAIFLTTLLAGITPGTSAGTTAANLAADLRSLLLTIGPKARSRLAWLMDGTTATEIATKTDTAGAPLHPAMGATGGELLGLPALVTDAMPRDSDGGVLMLVDAQRIGADAGIVTMDSSSEALVQMDTAPAEPTVAATVMTSLFQRNLKALRAQRTFGFEVVRANAVAALTAVNY